MSTTAAIPAIGPELQSPVSARSPAEDSSGQAAGEAPAAGAADLRLVIEEDKAANSFVYKTVDMRTGQVVQQFPREEVLRLKSTPDYEPGAVIDARG
jgi:flagellar protein FlaG